MVLIIDDNPDMLNIFKVLLEDEGIPCQVERSGMSALQYLKSAPVPELILLDCSMPLMSGEDFIKNLRESNPDRFSEYKIVGLSSFSESSGLVKNFKEAVLEYVEKPGDIDGILSLVRRHLN